MQYDDVEVAALCDIYKPYLDRDRSKVNARYLKDMPGQIPKMHEQFPKPPIVYNDYRKLLENKDIDPKDLRDERILIKKAPPYLMDVEGASQTYVF